jgi:hypothetical protein
MKIQFTGTVFIDANVVQLTGKGLLCGVTRKLKTIKKNSTFVTLANSISTF